MKIIHPRPAQRKEPQNVVRNAIKPTVTKRQTENGNILPDF